jgi:hypothetical protein
MCGRQVAGDKLEHTFHLWKTTNDTTPSKRRTLSLNHQSWSPQSSQGIIVILIFSSNGMIDLVDNNLLTEIMNRTGTKPYQRQIGVP